MVRIFRRRLLRLCFGRNSFLNPLPKLFNDGPVLENGEQNPNPVTVQPMPSIDVDQPTEETSPKADPGTLNSSKEQQPDYDFPEVKHRMKRRRKLSETHMIGVVFKKMKWQASICVDKKQIHLGTFGSQEEAARSYDRAAFFCGRETNFELTLKEKEDLGKLSWEEFLELTRTAIYKKNGRKIRASKTNV